MKIIFYAVISIFMIIVSSCYEPAQGNGVIIEDDRTNEDLIKSTQIISVMNKGIARVYVTKGVSQSVKVKTDENFKNDILTKINNKTLVISNKSMISPTFLEVYVVIEDITSLENSGSGRIIASEMFDQSSTLWIGNTGSGKIEINTCNVKSLEMFNSGSGTNIINNIVVETTSGISNTGSGKIEIKSGSTNDLGVKCSGSGSILLSNFNSKRCAVENSGSGSIYVNVATELNASISGSGNVYYYGNPSVKESVTGSGRLYKKN